jgi:hypothetical protein
MTKKNHGTSDLLLPPIGFGMWDAGAQVVKDTGQPLQADANRDAAQLAELHQAMAWDTATSTPQRCMPQDIPS